VAERPATRMCGLGYAVALTVASLLVSANTPRVQSPARPQSALQEVRAHLEAGRYEEAENAARAEISRLEDTAAEAADSNELLDLLVESLIRNGRGAEAQTLALAQDAVSRRENSSGQQGDSLAVSVRNLGDVLLDSGQYRQARAVFERAVSVRERPGSGSVDAADDLDHLAGALIWLERYDEALATINRALAIKERELTERDVRLARTLEVRGLLWQRRGEYPPARKDLERALAIRERGRTEHPETAALLTLLGEQYWFEGDLVQSRQTLRRAIGMARATLRAGHPGLAWTLISFAIPLDDLGLVGEARAIREEAVALAEVGLRADHPVVAVALNDLALSLIRQGDYAGARRLQVRALAIYDKWLGSENSFVTTLLQNLAILNVQIGDSIEASRLQRRAIATWERVVGPDHPYVAFSLDGFGEALAQAGRHREAVPLFERAVGIRERRLGTSSPRLAVSLAHLASSLHRLGSVRRASVLAARAANIWEQAGGSEGLSDALVIQGAIRLDLGQYREAAHAYDRALQIRLAFLGDIHPSTAEARAGLAAALAALGRTNDALTAALQAEGLGRDHLKLTLGYLPERQALGYARTRPKGLNLALSVAAREDAGQVLDAVIRGRSLILDEIASRRRTRTGRAGDALAPLWSSLTSARQRLANLAVRGPASSNPRQYASLLDEARREKEEAERALMERSAEFRSQLARADVGLAEVREALGSATALVSFVRYDHGVVSGKTGVPRAESTVTRASEPNRVRSVPSYIAFVLRPESGEPIAVPLGRAAPIDDLVARWRRAMMAGVRPMSRDTPPAGESIAALGAALRARIWDPIAAHLRGAARAYLVPDGTLNLVPFAALPVPRGRYLLESGPTLHYLSAERDLLLPQGGHSQGLLAIGNPAFADATQFAGLATPKREKQEIAARGLEQAETSLKPSAPALFRGGGASCLSFQAMRFESLPSSRREVEDIAALWRDLNPQSAATSDAQVLTGSAAQEPAFKRLGPGRRVLHLATHGFFLGDECGGAVSGLRGVGLLSPSRPPARRATASTLPENPLLLSGLVLAGANRRAAARADEDDGILTAEEVSSLNLDGVEWAVLSACDTGLGALQAGEGVFGLRRAFQTAGVRTVIMSLWSVEDRATRVWMRALYTARLKEKLDTAEAVRHASLTMLRDRRARGESTHPFFWASFVAAGDFKAPSDGAMSAAAWDAVIRARGALIAHTARRSILLAASAHRGASDPRTRDARVSESRSRITRIGPCTCGSTREMRRCAGQCNTRRRD
jgi:CHAT domain-containing protein/tetratricopeptide (TPR) repeat protein